ncbi:GTPase ObgE [bacterium]|nr:GTPase ObgE [bacterium]
MKKNLFVDQSQIRVVGGRGGNGSSHFHREKFVPLGGPDGGDGGNGGNVVFEAHESLKTLVDFTFQKVFAGQPGQAGSGKKCYGKQGKDIVVKVPIGTLVLNLNRELVADINHPGQSVVIAKGGRGGRGNVHFATALKRAPSLSEKGEPGEEQDLILELKLLADVGLVGLPNAGKSTLLSAVSAARPKIADYPFTTLTPNLGVIRIDAGASFVLVDIPGLIEGASQGLGLGHEFLRHVERTKLLIHVVDVGFPEVDPVEDFETINRELALFNPRVAKRPKLVALNKVDLVASKKQVEELKAHFMKLGYDVFIISAAIRTGVDSLMQQAMKLLKTLPEEPLDVRITPKVISGPVPRFVVEKTEPGVWRVQGREVEKWVAMTDFENDEAVDKLKNIFDRIGLSEAFKLYQVQEGDTVVVGKEEFLFKEDM